MTEPSSPIAAAKPESTPTQLGVSVATLTATISGIGALLPGKIGPTIISMAAPFLAAAIMWIAKEQAQEWLAERKAQAPTRRGERYLRQMNKDLRKMKPSDPRRLALEAKIAELEERLHAHKMSQLVLQAPTAPPTP